MGVSFKTFERALVKSYKCRGRSHYTPLCLYDFSVKHAVPDFFVLGVPDYSILLKKDYFDEKRLNGGYLKHPEEDPFENKDSQELSKVGMDFY